MIARPKLGRLATCAAIGVAAATGCAALRVNKDDTTRLKVAKYAGKVAIGSGANALAVGLFGPLLRN